MTAAAPPVKSPTPAPKPTTSSGLRYLVATILEMDEVDYVEQEVLEVNAVKEYCRQHCQARETREGRTE